MKLMRNLFVLIMVFVAGMSMAEQKKVFGDVEVHYIVIPTLMLDETSAKAYDIKRSKYYSMLNVSVLKVDSTGLPVVIEADVEIAIKNALGQVFRPDIKIVEETNARYFLAPFRFSDEEKLEFTITTTVGTKEYEFSYSQQVYR